MQRYNNKSLFSNILNDLLECIADPNSTACGQTAFEQTGNYNGNTNTPPAPPAAAAFVNYTRIALIVGIAAIAITAVIIFT